MLENKLSKQVENVKALQDILEEEKRCLTEKDFSTFNTVLFNKQKTLRSISALDKQLTTVKNLEKINNNSELIALKVEIENQLRSSQKLNQINGKLVELSMKSNKHLMQLMTQATGKNSVTYDQKGVLNGGQLLGKNIQA